MGHIWGALGRLCATAEMAITSCEARSSESFYEHLTDVLGDMTSKQYEKLNSFIETYTGMLERTVEAGRNKKFGHVEEIQFDDEDHDVRSAVRVIINGITKFRSDLDRNRYATDAAVASITSALEVLCTELLRNLFEIRPRAIPGNPTIDLETILATPSTRTTLAVLAERQAVEMARGAIEDWISYLALHCGVRLPKKMTDWPNEWLSVVWMAHQRNCIIHRGGAIDSKLREKAARCGKHLDSDLTVITLTPADVQELVLSTLSVATRLLTGFCDTHLPEDHESNPNRKTIRKMLALEQFELMSRGQFEIARAITSETSPQDEVTIDEIAHWYTLLTTEGISDTNKIEISSAKWGSDAGSVIHRSILLDAEEEACNLIQNLIGRGLVSAIEMRHNPEYFRAKQYLRNPDNLAKESTTDQTA